MGILRNSIEVTGIASEEELPKQINGQLIEYSETDYIYVPESRPLIYSVSKVKVDVNIKESRTVNAPTGRIVILEGSKRLSITYRPIGYYEENYTLKFDLPFNTFIDLPNNAGDIKSVDIYVVDAYFKLMNNRKLYSFMVFMVNAVYQSKVENSIHEPEGSQFKNLKQFDYEEE